MNLTELSELIVKREVSPVEILGSLLSDIESQNPSYNVYVNVASELALEQAQRAETPPKMSSIHRAFLRLWAPRCTVISSLITMLQL